MRCNKCYEKNGHSELKILWEQISWGIKCRTQFRKDTLEEVMLIPKVSVGVKESLKYDPGKRANTYEDVRGSLIFLQNLNYNEDQVQSEDLS